MNIDLKNFDRAAIDLLIEILASQMTTRDLLIQSIANLTNSDKDELEKIYDENHKDNRQAIWEALYEDYGGVGEIGLHK